MTTGKPGMRTAIQIKGRVGKNLRERKLMGLPVTPSVFCYFFWGACQKVADSEMLSLP